MPLRDEITIQHYGVPFEWGHLVCECTDEETQQQVKSGKRWSRTRAGQPVAPCGRVPRYLLRRCERCEQPYVKAFKHEHDCISVSLCWSCLEQTEESLCKSTYNHFEHFYCTGKTGERIPPEPKFLEKRKKLKPEDIKFEKIPDL